MNLPAEACFHNLAIVSIKKRYPGHAFKVMNAIWGLGQLMFTKCIFVVDDDVERARPGRGGSGAWATTSIPSATCCSPAARSTSSTTPRAPELRLARWASTPRGSGPREGFTRPWPGDVVMTDEVKRRVDAIWGKLGAEAPRRPPLKRESPPDSLKCNKEAMKPGKGGSFLILWLPYYISGPSRQSTRSWRREWRQRDRRPAGGDPIGDELAGDECRADAGAEVAGGKRRPPRGRGGGRAAARSPSCRRATRRPAHAVTKRLSRRPGAAAEALLQQARVTPWAVVPRSKPTNSTVLPSRILPSGTRRQVEVAIEHERRTAGGAASPARRSARGPAPRQGCAQ